MNNSKNRLLLVFDLLLEDDDDEPSNAEVEEGESWSSSMCS